MKNRRYLFLILILISFLHLTFYSNELLGRLKSLHENRIFARAEVIKIDKKPISKDDPTLVETIISLKILSGDLEGQVKELVFKGEDDLPKEMNRQVGDRLFIGISTVADEDIASEGSREYISLYDTDNTFSIIIMSILLLVVIVVIGRIKGILSLLALIITILLLFLIFIPLTLSGYPSLPIAILISIISIFITLPIIAGIKLKTLAAVLGASGGIIIASLLALFFGWIMHISGFVSNEMLTVFYASDTPIDLRSIALSGMIIAALGAIMDVCISIASSTAEIFNADPNISEKDAFNSVMNVGTDILGSMVNTLILAYVGSSLSLILFISIRIDPGMPFGMLLNYNPILSELVKSAVGSIGMFLAVPLTAFISVRLYKMKN